MTSRALSPSVRARTYGRDNVLDGWRPDISADVITYLVTPVGQGGRYSSVQAAITEAVHQAKTGKVPRAIRIEIAPGCYDGIIHVPRLRIAGRDIPISLVGLGAAPDDTCLRANLDARLPGRDYGHRFAHQIDHMSSDLQDRHHAIARRTQISTGNACVLRMENHGGHLKNLDIQNTYGADRAPPKGADWQRNAFGQYSDETHQAVALKCDCADRVAMHRVQMWGYQDTFFAAAPRGPAHSRLWLKECLIAGDVDFIFGGATAYFESCELLARTGRSPNIWCLAPSTQLSRRFGFVFHGCRFTQDGTIRNRVRLGRQWFEGVRATPYGTPNIADYRTVLGPKNNFDPPFGCISRYALEAVGKAALVSCTLDTHFRMSKLWDDWKGEEFLPTGAMAPIVWTPRYRPVQPDAQAFLAGLKTWPDFPQCAYQHIDQKQIFLDIV